MSLVDTKAVDTLCQGYYYIEQHCDNDVIPQENYHVHLQTNEYLVLSIARNEDKYE